MSSWLMLLFLNTFIKGEQAIGSIIKKKSLSKISGEH